MPEVLAHPEFLTWTPEIERLQHELTHVELESAVIVDRCDGPALAELRHRKRQILAELEREKVAVLAREKAA
jgi:hypothetical protein